MQKKSIKRLTLRIYDSKDNARLEDIKKQIGHLYPSENTMIVDLLIRGIESFELESQNITEMKSSGNIFKELKRISALLDRFVDVGYEHYKESFVINNENQTLISRLYDVIFRLAKEKGISIENYNKGIFDGLPDGFEEITDALLEDYKAREHA